MMQMFEGKKIVLFGAHPDDIECGMGGTLNQLVKYQPKIVVFADTIQYNGDVIRDEFQNSMKTQEVSGELYSFEVDNMEKDKVEMRRKIYEYRDYDIIFSPSKHSQHQDHRMIGQAVDDIMLEKTVFYYEDIRSGQHEIVNFWNSLSEEDMEAKYKMIEQYGTQIAKRHYFNTMSIKTMAKFRGGQVNTEYAEGFQVLRLVL